MTTELLVGLGALFVSIANGIAIIIAAIAAARKLNATVETMNLLEKNTNSIKDALVAATEKEALARGRSDVLAEQRITPPR